MGLSGAVTGPSDLSTRITAAASRSQGTTWSLRASGTACTSPFFEPECRWGVSMDTPTLAHSSAIHDAVEPPLVQRSRGGAQDRRVRRPRSRVALSGRSIWKWSMNVTAAENRPLPLAISTG
ncbi:hypothetical protein [Nonomuraea helvata]|uniref:Uncharacterized protein n=1 Tax=Nonomuraea helvata TaxID=37484 RepID=A0ABV5S509_9ACTN